MPVSSAQLTPDLLDRLWRKTWPVDAAIIVLYGQYEIGRASDGWEVVLSKTDLDTRLSKHRIPHRKGEPTWEGICQLARILTDEGLGSQAFERGKNQALAEVSAASLAKARVEKRYEAALKRADALGYPVVQIAAAAGKNVDSLSVSSAGSSFTQTITAMALQPDFPWVLEALWDSPVAGAALVSVCQCRAECAHQPRVLATQHRIRHLVAQHQVATDQHDRPTPEGFLALAHLLLGTELTHTAVVDPRDDPVLRKRLTDWAIQRQPAEPASVCVQVRLPDPGKDLPQTVLSSGAPSNASQPPMRPRVLAPLPTSAPGAVNTTPSPVPPVIPPGPMPYSTQPGLSSPIVVAPPFRSPQHMHPAPFPRPPISPMPPPANQQLQPSAVIAPRPTSTPTVRWSSTQSTQVFPRGGSAQQPIRSSDSTQMIRRPPSLANNTRVKNVGIVHVKVTMPQIYATPELDKNT